MEFWGCPGVGLRDPCDSLQLRLFHEQALSREAFPANLSLLGPRKTIAATGKTKGTGAAAGISNISWFHRFSHVWTRMFLGCVDSPEVPQLLTTSHQQRFISTP